MATRSRVPSFESILQQFRHRRGLYVLGAGTSAGLAPIGHGLYRIVALDWWRNGGGFRPDIPIHSVLTQKIIDSQINCPQEEIWGREIRPGTEPFPAVEMLQRLPNGAARLHVMHELVKERHKTRETDSYRVFRAFHPSIILNYNHDGFASAQCGSRHWIIDVHGSIDPWFGSPDLEALIARVREFDVSIPIGDLTMCEPEDSGKAALRRRLATAGSITPEFVAIIGYSFAKGRDSYDDHISFEWFTERFHGFAGCVYVLDPSPEELRYAVADAIGSDRVFGVRAWWNVLSHAFMLHLQDRGFGRSIYATHETLLSIQGGGYAFPRP